MTALTDEPDLDEIDEPLPGRPRRRPLNRVTVPLLGLLLAAAGFLGGIEAEKGHGSTASASAAASRFARLGARSGAASRGRFGSTRGGSGFTPPSGAGGFAAAGGGTTGTISSISGRTLYVKETSGTTVKVTLTSVTSLKKDQSVSRNAIRPGDSITVQGASGAGGSIKATSISDSGHASTSTS